MELWKTKIVLPSLVGLFYARMHDSCRLVGPFVSKGWTLRMVVSTSFRRRKRQRLLLTNPLWGAALARQAVFSFFFTCLDLAATRQSICSGFISPTLQCTQVLLVLAVIPGWIWLIEAPSAASGFTVLTLWGVGAGLFTATPYFWSAEVFPTNIRSSGFLAYNLSVSVFGGCGPLICAALVESWSKVCPRMTGSRGYHSQRCLGSWHFAPFPLAPPLHANPFPPLAISEPRQCVWKLHLLPTPLPLRSTPTPHLTFLLVVSRLVCKRHHPPIPLLPRSTLTLSFPSLVCALSRVPAPSLTSYCSSALC